MESILKGEVASASAKIEEGKQGFSTIEKFIKKIR